MKTPDEFSPTQRYGHSAVVYEPASSGLLAALKNNLRLADINQRIAQNSQVHDMASDQDQDTSYMVVFGGKNAESDVLFNDIYFLGIP